MGRNNHQKVTSEWIPVSERLPEAASERIPVPERWPDDAQYQGGFHPIYPVTTKYGVLRAGTILTVQAGISYVGS